MSITVETIQYEWKHGQKPHQQCHGLAVGWVFWIDSQERQTILVGTYRRALRQAKAMAKHTVTVVP